MMLFDFMSTCAKEMVDGTFISRLPLHSAFPHMSQNKHPCVCYPIVCSCAAGRGLGREAMSNTQEFLSQCLLPTTTHQSHHLLLTPLWSQVFSESHGSRSILLQLVISLSFLTLAFNFHGQTRIQYRFLSFDNNICTLWTLIIYPLKCKVHSLQISERDEKNQVISFFSERSRSFLRNDLKHHVGLQDRNSAGI